MIEVLVATMLMMIILLALATVTAQWMPNWNRGMTRVQQLERLGIGLDRIAADIASAQFVSLGGGVKSPLFEGSALSLSFIRNAAGPNAAPGLEIVRLSERADAQGLALVREHAKFLPAGPDAPIQFTDPVVLIRAPYRVSFSYAGIDQAWQPDWQNQPVLPAMVRVAVRDAATDRVLSASPAVIVSVNVAANCVRAKIVASCLASGEADDGALPGLGGQPAAPPAQSVPPGRS